MPSRRVGILGLFCLKTVIHFVHFGRELKERMKVVIVFIPLHEKFLQFDWLRAVVFQLNLEYLHVKITKPLQVVV